MPENYHKAKEGFMSMIGLLFAVAIIAVLCYFVVTTYVKPPVADTSVQEAASQAGIDTSNYKSVLETTKTTVKDIEKQQMDRQKQLGDW
ncbi:hypothetical protein ACFL1E_01870 [Candidatus Omnitrophota bacterium]